MEKSKRRPVKGAAGEIEIVWLDGQKMDPAPKLIKPRGLQICRSSLSVKQAAALMNVSERTVYMARELMDTGRQDLVGKVEAGSLSLLAALKQAKPKKYAKAKNGLATLRRAWATASEADRAAFLREVSR